MTAGEFAAIIRKVTEHVQLEDSAQLTFEVSDGISPIGLYGAAMPAIETDAIWIELSRGRPAATARSLASCGAGAASWLVLRT